MSSEINEKDCPLCQQENHCAVSKGDSGEHCWCQQYPIETTLINEVPAPLKFQSCICQACATKANPQAREAE